MVRRGHNLGQSAAAFAFGLVVAIVGATLAPISAWAQQAGFAGSDSGSGPNPLPPITRSSAPTRNTTIAGKDATPPKWSATEVAAALKACKQILKKYGAIAEPLSPLRHGECGTPAPIRLIQLGKSGVRFDPPPTVNCQMVAALSKWLDTSVQPQARKHLGSPVASISVMSSYSCRRAYGRRKARFSEHAFANALDIGGFVTRKGIDTRLLAHWGPTQRDLLAREQERPRISARTTPAPATGQTKPTITKPSAKTTADALHGTTRRSTRRAHTPAKTEGPVAPPATTVVAPALAPVAGVVTPPPVPMRRPSLKERLRGSQQAKVVLRSEADEAARLAAYRAQVRKFLYPMSRLGGPKPVRVTRRSRGDRSKRSAIDQSAFLRQIHKDACGIFGTVLGPAANEAHRNHFHVDLAQRRRSNYCR